MLLIFGGSTDALSARRTSRFIVPFLRWLRPDLSEAAIHRVQLMLRKSGHLTEYAVLAMLLWRAVRQPAPSDARVWSWPTTALVIFLAALYAASDEFHQYFVATREASIWDVVLDTIGAGLGLGLLRARHRIAKSP